MKEYFIGIGGIGMSALALHEHFKGNEVCGSNLEENERARYLRNIGLKVRVGHSYENVPDDVDLVVKTRAVNDSNPEILRAKDLNVEILERNDMMIEEVHKLHPSIGVTGTDGKTTTTAMIYHVLKKMGERPYGFLGGIHKKFEHGNYSKGEKGVVFELDESTPVFSKYRVTHLVITNSRGDHLENFKNDIRYYIKSFIDLVKNVEGITVTFIDDEFSGELGDVTFGIGRGDFSFVERRANGKSQIFTFKDPEGKYHDVTLSVPGFHNCLDALATIALLSTIGYPVDAVIESLSDFVGVSRRFTISFKDEERELYIIDDYAHTPEEVKNLLLTVREVFPDKKVVAVFQPHRYTRTLRENGRFPAALEFADEIFVTKIYGAYEKGIRVSAKDIVKGLEKNGKNAKFVENLADFVHTYVPENNSVVVFIGAGDIINYSAQFVNRLREAIV
ncbi:MAG: UDP-N-acetylmuramate--L-alanine ligase [Thermotogaceae bacterium]|nr:UDP-N-acetylmuramate--L-alanine ligase [Thermotogaceae bacterium]